MWIKMSRRARFAWHAARFFARMFLEYVMTVWLLGIAPFLAHLATASPQRGYGWIPNDLYLFVMVTGGSTAIEAFKDRESDGPLRPVAAVFGASAVAFGAWAFGVLEEGPGPMDATLKTCTASAIAIGLGIDLVYRVPKMIIDARAEAARKGRAR